ncbi:MAG: CoA transferase [Dehalococcoidia bacterium]|jgi:crotonobetainyl-CoA:carnitine CoA-transferase CaiB-like acyl-CoA transferase|nr:CoA transferase [Dehalococcoidia bacterium]
MTGQGAPVGPLDGIRVIEWTDEKGTYAGKLLADAGADVVKIESPSGDPTRLYEPFVGDESNSERSLWFWHYNTNKSGITLDLEQERGRELFRELVASADAVVESQPPGRMAELGIDYADLSPSNRPLIWVAITPFGREAPRAHEHSTDLTLLAGGGPAWSCGYDDHSLPPVRGGGNQGYQTGCHYAVMSLLVALVHRDISGTGQFIDVNMHAASNVTTEAGSYEWLVANETVQRQTGRHAAVNPTQASQVQCADGVWVNTGLPRRQNQFQVVYDWLELEGLLEKCESAPILLAAAQGPPFQTSQIALDDEVRAKFMAGRDAMTVLADNLNGYDYFTGGQERGFQLGIIYAPEDVMEDPHFIERGFVVELDHPELDASYRYPGAPYRFEKTPWRLDQPAPALGADNEAVYGALGHGDELDALRERGVI